MRPEDCGKLSSIMTRLSASDVPVPDRELLADLVSFGDGGFFCDRIATPLFYVRRREGVRGSAADLCVCVRFLETLHNGAWWLRPRVIPGRVVNSSHR